MARLSVPKSPKRNIFAIEDFLGVDLTNTETSIDDYRSPNAENMVRWTPGKVRKRTGYKTKYQFGRGTDVNRAVKTSSTWEELFTESEDDVVFEIYGNAIPVAYVYFDYYARGVYDIYIDFADGANASWHLEDSGMAFDYFSQFEYNANTHGGVKSIRIAKDTSALDPQYFQIKNLRVCDSTEAVSQSEWNDLTWSAAPEDTGIQYIVTGDNASSIYGYHRMKTGTVSGSRVVNVNRVLGTSDEWVTFTFDRSTRIYDLGECLYIDDELYTEGMNIYVTFDYMSDNDARMLIAGNYYPDYMALHDTDGATEHKEFQIKCGSYGALDTIHLKPERSGETVNVKIKNMSIVYEKDEDYTWKEAPEDNNQRFYIEDIYDINSKNRATTKEYTGTVETSSATPHTGSIRVKVRSTAKYKGFVRVGFDLTAGSSDTQKIQVILEDDAENRWIVDEVASDITAKRYNLIVSGDTAENYIKYIEIKFYTNAGGVEGSVNLTGIKYNEITPKTNYGVSKATYIYHTGARFYARKDNSDDFTLLYSDANKRRSQSWQINDQLIIIDGKDIYRYPYSDVNDTKVKVLSNDVGYIPTITIAKSPEGGGTPYEPFNLIQSAFWEQFTVDSDHAAATDFQLSFGELDTAEVVAEILDNDGDWNTVYENEDFTVNRETGVVSFTTAPGVTPITGEDNVRIKAEKTIIGYKDRIRKCTFGILYGVGGEADRLFLSGNPDYPNWDFYSEQYDPSYFPDTGYSALGSKHSAIVGYAIVNNYLATFKDEYDSQRSVYIREGSLYENEATGVLEPVFRIVNTLQGNGAIASYAFENLQTEPLFLTREGIYAITPQDITGEKYSQNRSFYLNGKLTKEKGLEEAIALVYKDQYILAVNNKFYILDGLQASRTDKSEPYATRQYAGFYCTNIPALSMWEEEQALWIGTDDGKVCRFNTDINSNDSYNDDGQAIYACWETPDLDGRLFYKHKTFKYFAARLKSSYKTSHKLWNKKFGYWTLMKEDLLACIWFDFEHIDFEQFTFSCDRSNKVAHSRVLLRKVDKARFRIENGKKNEPFGIVDLALEYTETSNYRNYRG